MSDYIVSQKIWLRVSADYDAEPRLRTAIFDGSATLKEVMAWAESGHVLGRGDIRITEDEGPSGESHE